MNARARIKVTEHSFGLFDHYDIPIHSADWSTGLIVEMATGAMIYTGISHGHVNVTVDARDTPPEQIDAGPWDDIVEATLHAPRGDLRVNLLEYADGKQPPQLPLLSSRGPGTYRLRAHVRGRDNHFDAAHDDPGEHYLLTIWPAAPLSPLIIRATDQCGYSVRLAQLASPTAARAQQPRSAPTQPIVRDARMAQLRQAILDGRARAKDGDRPAQ